MAKRGRPRKDIDQERVYPTPETALKLKPDPLASLDPALQRLAHEIALIHAAMSGRLTARIQRWQEGRSPSARDPIDRIKDHRIQYYVNWLRLLSKRRILSSVVLDILADMVPPYMADQTHKLQPGTSAEWLIESLQLYGTANS